MVDSLCPELQWDGQVPALARGALGGKVASATGFFASKGMGCAKYG